MIIFDIKILSMARSRDNSGTQKRHADVVKRYNEVLKSYGTLAPFISKKKINEEVAESDGINYSAAFVGLIMQRHIKHGSL